MGIPEQMFQTAHLQMMENNCVNFFLNPSTITEVMIRTNVDGEIQTYTHPPHKKKAMFLKGSKSMFIQETFT